MKEKDPWKTLLQGKLADHREAPPPDLWPRLEQRLGPAGRPAPRLCAAARLRLAGSVLSAAAALTALFILLRYPAAVPPEQAPAVMSHIRNSAARQPDAPHRQHAKELTAGMPSRAIATALPEKQPMTPADHHGPAAPALAALADSRPDSAVCPTPPPGDRPTPGPAAKRAPHLRPTPAYRRQPDARTAYAGRLRAPPLAGGRIRRCPIPRGRPAAITRHGPDEHPTPLRHRRVNHLAETAAAHQPVNPRPPSVSHSRGAECALPAEQPLGAGKRCVLLLPGLHAHLRQRQPAIRCAAKAAIRGHSAERKLHAGRKVTLEPVCHRRRQHGGMRRRDAPIPAIWRPARRSPASGSTSG